MERKKTFLVVLIALLFAGRAAAQAEYPRGQNSLELRRTVDLNKLLPSGQPTPRQPFGVFSELKGVRTGGGSGSAGGSALSDDYYTRHFGFFCKKELEFEKTTRIPLKFRLGSLDYCNSLEGKR